MSTPFTLPSQAASGFSNAESYDKHRPSYPSDAIGRLLDHLGISNVSNAKIIDLAAGTGKFTQLLTARPEKYEVIAIEPHAQMRGVLKNKAIGIEVLDGNAGNMPIEDGWGDALVAAQAFHWFATEESLAEIHRVLRPGAAFGMIWNIEEYNGPRSWTPTVPWQKELKAIIASLRDDHARFRDMEWKEVFEQQLNSTPLETLKDTIMQQMPKFSLPLGEETVAWTVYLNDDEIWLRYSTLSQISNLNAEKKEEVKQRVFETLSKKDVERNEKGDVALRGVTYMAWTSRV